MSAPAAAAGGLGDALPRLVAQAVQESFAALPKTGKPQPHEHTVLAGEHLVLPLQCCRSDLCDLCQRFGPAQTSPPLRAEAQRSNDTNPVWQPPNRLCHHAAGRSPPAARRGAGHGHQVPGRFRAGGKPGGAAARRPRGGHSAQSADRMGVWGARSSTCGGGGAGGIGGWRQSTREQQRHRPRAGAGGSGSPGAVHLLSSQAALCSGAWLAHSHVHQSATVW